MDRIERGEVPIKSDTHAPGPWSLRFQRASPFTKFRVGWQIANQRSWEFTVKFCSSCNVILREYAY